MKNITLVRNPDSVLALGREVVLDESISLAAKGLFWILQSLPSGFSAKNLSDIYQDDSIAAQSLQELKTAGYVKLSAEIAGEHELWMIVIVNHDYRPDIGMPKSGGSLGGFDEFWRAYPRHVGRKAAELKWSSKHCSSIKTQVMSALENHKKTKQWMSGFVPHASTWLFQERWNDSAEEIDRPSKR